MKILDAYLAFGSVCFDLFCQNKMQSKTILIVIASTFVIGVAAFIAALYWELGMFRMSRILAIVLAISLGISVSRGDVSSRWLTFGFSSFGAILSFSVFLDVRSKFILFHSKEITGEAFLLPGVLFSVCSTLLIASFLASFVRNQGSAE